MDVALLIASTVAQAGPLSTFCEEPGQTFSLQARAELDQGPSQAAVQVLHDKELEDEVPDDGIKSNQLAIATELVQRLLHIYFGERPLQELIAASSAVRCESNGVGSLDATSSMSQSLVPLCLCLSG